MNTDVPQNKSPSGVVHLVLWNSCNPIDWQRIKQTTGTINNEDLCILVAADLPPDACAENGAKVMRLHNYCPQFDDLEYERSIVRELLTHQRAEVLNRIANTSNASIDLLADSFADFFPPGILALIRYLRTAILGLSPQHCTMFFDDNWILPPEASAAILRVSNPDSQAIGIQNTGKHESLNAVRITLRDGLVKFLFNCALRANNLLFTMRNLGARRRQRLAFFPGKSVNVMTNFLDLIARNKDRYECVVVMEPYWLRRFFSELRAQSSIGKIRLVNGKQVGIYSPQGWLKGWDADVDLASTVEKTGNIAREIYIGLIRQIITRDKKWLASFPLAEAKRYKWWQQQKFTKAVLPAVDFAIANSVAQLTRRNTEALYLPTQFDLLDRNFDKQKFQAARKSLLHSPDFYPNPINLPCLPEGAIRQFAAILPGVRRILSTPAYTGSAMLDLKVKQRGFKGYFLFAAQYPRHEKYFWHRLGEMMQAFPEWLLMFRRHPRTKHLGVSLASYPNVMLSEAAPLEQQILGCRIFLSHSSSVVLEAVAAGKTAFELHWIDTTPRFDTQALGMAVVCTTVNEAVQKIAASLQSAS